MPLSRTLALLSAIAPLALGAPALAAPPTPQDIWTHHILNNQIFRGKTAIANVFRQLFEIFGPGQNRVDPAVIDGRTLYITWHYTPKAEPTFFGSDTFLVENGKIQLQTIASELYVGHPVQP